MSQNLGAYKSWVTSFQPGTFIYREQEAFTVMSAGTDFIILKNAKDGSKVRLFRNTPESYQFTDAPLILV